MLTGGLGNPKVLQIFLLPALVEVLILIMLQSLPPEITLVSGHGDVVVRVDHRQQHQIKNSGDLSRGDLVPLADLLQEVLLELALVAVDLDSCL